jgi:hypothetical protein
VTVQSYAAVREIQASINMAQKECGKVVDVLIVVIQILVALSYIILIFFSFRAPVMKYAKTGNYRSIRIVKEGIK